MRSLPFFRERVSKFYQNLKEVHGTEKVRNPFVDKGNMTFRPSITVYQSKRRNVPEDEFPSFFFFSHRAKSCETEIFDSFT